MSVAPGLMPGARQVSSPNVDERPPHEAVTLAVLHAISLPPEEFGGDAVERFFTNCLDCDAHPYFAQLRELRVSSHLFIRRDGEVVQFVPFDARAWHAGVSCWRNRERCNDFSVGIELEGSDLQPFTDAQYQRLAECLAELVTRLPIADIAGHADIAPGRKTDPGPHFDWARLQRELAAHLDEARAADLLAARSACA